ncbi:hypothetical protein M8C21_011367 [Ambrosia artemisiifolia]|uniref:UspA domain-containing protein n=1 Tax=Ambrosia artemisiifolia TaxID=4212 RepID=A0AAD5DAZ1_AMBAR|nr:hypothetical protein M8C21_006665 [Ambrosia artemisiifolia]KAI7756232.1 hypothetical protein M8C21_011367 [Ambrosia artemisiifolia]
MAKARTIGIAMDYSTTSKTALKWAVDNLIGPGDTVVVLLVLSPKSDPVNKQLFEDTGSPLIPLVELKEIGVCKKYGITPDSEIFDMLDCVSVDKKANVVAKVYWGDPREKLCEAVNHLKLDSIVVGSRGLGTLKRVLLGSVSSHVVENATCPVTVVK